jgi:lipoprotein-releasing system ATP-binding protein
MSNLVLELKDVNKSFRQGGGMLTILQSVDLSVKYGEMVALVGPSGSGKSTLLQIAGLLDCPTLGTVTIGGVVATKASDAVRTKLRLHKIGFVYQFHHLLPEFTALENVMLPLIIQGVSTKQAKTQALELLEQLSLQERVKHFPAELSGGEQQRVAIARALITKPLLLLADEPTGNLDAVSAKIVFDLLLSLAKERNLATFVVTHNLDLALMMDRIVTLQNGELVKYE